MIYEEYYRRIVAVRLGGRRPHDAAVRRATKGRALDGLLSAIGPQADGASRLFGVVKDNAERMSHAVAKAADAMPKIDAIFAPRAFDRTVVDGERHRVALP